jgi:hypothetical protein
MSIRKVVLPSNTAIGAVSLTPKTLPEFMTAVTGAVVESNRLLKLVMAKVFDAGMFKK